MAQRSITSFFKKVETSEKKDNNTSSSKSKISDVDDAVEGKRKRDNDTSPSSPPTKKNNIIKKTKSTVKKLESNKKKIKPETSIIKSLNKSLENKNDNVVVKKSTKKRARIIEESSSDEDNLPTSSDTLEKDDETKANTSSTSNNGKLKILSDSESDCDDKKEKSLTPDKKSIKKDSDESLTDDEIKNKEKENNDDDKSSPKSSPTKKSKKNNKKIDEKKIKSSPSPSPSKKPVKNLSAFFSKKQDNTENVKDIKYDPSLTKYDPINDACWKKGDKVPYIALTKTFELIEDTSSRLKMIDILANYYRSVIVLSPDDLLPSIYLCLNSLAPSYEGIELGLADTTLMKAIAQCTGRTMSQIKSDIHKTGDIGCVAENSRSNQRMMVQPSPLMVSNVFIKLREIANLTGSSSVEKKVNKIQSLFVACRESEAKFLIRSLAGKLRIGLAEQSVLSALSLACTLTPPNQNEYPPKIINSSKNLTSDKFKDNYDKISLIIKTTYCECPNFDAIIPVLFNDGVYELPNKCKLRPGVPLKPMLAHPTKGVQEVLKRFDGLKFTCEWKYDGERAQIHVDNNGNITIYSRNQENNTSKYPDIIKRLNNVLNRDKVKSCILDCESVAWDDEKKQILPFQILSTRKRKNANESDIKVKVCVFMFDLLYFNGESLVQETFSKRRELLKNNFQEIEGEWKFATHLDTTKIEEVQEFLEESVKGNCEGLMIKTLDEDATYEIAKRSRNWLKLKKDYLEGVGDTIDVVVIGGYIGKGKRTGTYGGFLLACYDSQNEEYQSICKIGTGFSEDDLTKHTAFLKDHIVKTAKSYYRVDSSLEPDHWFEPVQVWEIKCADLSLSPVHTAAAGIVDPSKGISLRFPRFIKIRDDKNPDDATSAQQIADMYNNQEQIINQQAAAGGANTSKDDYDF